MPMLYSAFNARAPMNKAGINSSCHGESARAPARCLHWEAPAGRSSRGSWERL